MCGKVQSPSKVVMNHGPSHQKKKTIITNLNLVPPKPKMPTKIEWKLNDIFQDV